MTLSRLLIKRIIEDYIDKDGNDSIHFYYYLIKKLSLVSKEWSTFVVPLVQYGNLTTTQKKHHCLFLLKCLERGCKFKSIKGLYFTSQMDPLIIQRFFKAIDQNTAFNPTLPLVDIDLDKLDRNFMTDTLTVASYDNNSKNYQQIIDYITLHIPHFREGIKKLCILNANEITIAGQPVNDIIERYQVENMYFTGDCFGGDLIGSHLKVLLLQVSVIDRKDNQDDFFYQLSKNLPLIEQFAIKILYNYTGDTILKAFVGHKTLKSLKVKCIFYRENTDNLYQLITTTPIEYLSLDVRINTSDGTIHSINTPSALQNFKITSDFNLAKKWSVQSNLRVINCSELSEGIAKSVLSYHRNVTKLNIARLDSYGINGIIKLLSNSQIQFIKMGSIIKIYRTPESYNYIHNLCNAIESSQLKLVTLIGQIKSKFTPESGNFYVRDTVKYHDSEDIENDHLNLFLDTSKVRDICLLTHLSFEELTELLRKIFSKTHIRAIEINNINFSLTKQQIKQLKSQVRQYYSQSQYSIHPSLLVLKYIENDLHLENTNIKPKYIYKQLKNVWKYLK
ncbi:hypothetical protein DLAC_01311 [Tieghemostelium lacteum]|uniref:Uncharacterized protein n=1 Tax=Tieghemostelium lacteum TaxID=361077 RepID=A0A152A899_TIELA|nr:hypothetical protein DLAC_01311 [Tieghemostelium lacteum]|eukprot:KYR02470.1 hypothetical protein DLAC_01311 [Tieghemostelium lacteum]